MISSRDGRWGGGSWRLLGMVVDVGFGRERLPALLWLLAVKSGHLLEFPGLLKTQTSGPGADRSALCRQWYLGCGLGSSVVKKQGERWTGSGYICEKSRVVVGSEQET